MKRLFILALAIASLNCAQSFAAEYIILNKTGKDMDVILWGETYAGAFSGTKGNYNIDMDSKDDVNNPKSVHLANNASKSYSFDDYSDPRTTIKPDNVKIKFAGDSIFSKAKKDTEASKGTDQTITITMGSDGLPHISFEDGEPLRTKTSQTGSNS